MREIPGHPFDLGADWNLALAGGTPNWDDLFAGYVAAVDWPASMFWRELSKAYPESLVLLSVRNSAEEWWHSADKTILPYARMSLAPDWNDGRGLVALLQRISGSEQWDDPATMMAAYEQHNAEVRMAVPRHRLLEWRATEGWEPICRALDVPTPDVPFPWINQSSEWIK
jgi:hypothetical protein